MGRKSPFLAFLLPITPCAQLGRDSERRSGTSQAGTLGLYQPMLNSNFVTLTLTRPTVHTKLHFLIKLINFPYMTPSPLRRRESWIPWFVWNLSDHIHCINFKYICTTTELTTPNKKETGVFVAAKTQAHNFTRSWVSPGYRKCTALPSNEDKLASP